MVKECLFSEICIIKKFLNEINQLYEVQKDIETSFSDAGLKNYRSIFVIYFCRSLMEAIEGPR